MASKATRSGCRVIVEPVGPGLDLDQRHMMRRYARRAPGTRASLRAWRMRSRERRSRRRDLGAGDKLVRSDLYAAILSRAQLEPARACTFAFRSTLAATSSPTKANTNTCCSGSSSSIVVLRYSTSRRLARASSSRASV